MGMSAPDLLVRRLFQIETVCLPGRKSLAKRKFTILLRAAGVPT
jgi:hypothetical protein